MTMTLAFNKCFQVGYSHGDKRRVIEGHYIYYYSQPPQMTSAVICCMFVENCTIISIALPPCCMVVVVKKRHQKVKNSRSTIFLLPFQKVVCSLSFKMCSYGTGKNHCLRCHEEADFLALHFDPRKSRGPLFSGPARLLGHKKVSSHLP